MDYKSDPNLDLVDLDHPGLESLVFKHVPLEDLQTRRELGIALIAEQPAQVAEKEPCEVILRILVDQSSIQLDSI